MFTLYKLTQFKTMDINGNTPLTLGKVGGKGVEVSSLDLLFISDIFYIPNVSVQDLK